MILRCYASTQEITGNDTHEIDTTPQNISLLREWLIAKWPALNQTTFTISINRKIVNDPNHPIAESDEVALLPPFSGG
ncbi:MAG: MoaD/ThiS family protein [Bacteroidota bacterium]|jgi:molybdopterin converting factor small subunit